MNKSHSFGLQKFTFANLLNVWNNKRFLKSEGIPLKEIFIFFIEGETKNTIFNCRIKKLNNGVIFIIKDKLIIKFINICDYYIIK